MRVLFIGEEHTNGEFHRAQLRVIEALHAAGRKVIVGLEMFPWTTTTPLERWSRGELTESQFLDDFLNQGRIIKFETADAERKMLEAGKDITKGPRARGPRPNVPNASYQYWAFLGEYWIDELGFYEHSIKNECLSEVFE